MLRAFSESESSKQSKTLPRLPTEAYKNEQVVQILANIVASSEEMMLNFDSSMSADGVAKILNAALESETYQKHDPFPQLASEHYASVEV